MAARGVVCVQGGKVCWWFCEKGVMREQVCSLVGFRARCDARVGEFVGGCGGCGCEKVTEAGR